MDQDYERINEAKPMLNMNSKFKLDKHGNCCSAKAERHNKKEKKKICTLEKKRLDKRVKNP
jgi:hypothetical protein